MAEQVQVALEPPAVARARWWVEQIRRRGEGLTEADLLEHMVFTGGWSASKTLEFWRSLPPEVEQDVLLSIEPLEAGSARAIVQSADGSRAEFKCWVDPEPPHRMLRGWRTKLAEGITFREATSDDGDALLALERAAPMQLGDHTVTTEHSDWFAQLRLMEDAVAFVGEDDGAVVGVQCCGRRTVLIDGADQPVGYDFRTRVDPEHRKGGVFSSLNARCNEWNRAQGAQSMFGYVREDNERMLALMVPEMKWDTRVELLSLTCAELAGPPVGRAATANDAERVVELINAAHGRKEFFRPYTVESLLERLGRAPDLYGWDSLVMTDDAVVGVWDTGLTVHREGPDGRLTAREAFVLDYGFGPGAERDLRALLAATSSHVAEVGITSLCVFSSVGSPGRQMLTELPGTVDRFVFLWWKPAEPVDVAERGLYVDPIYF